jgi:hypothetical protein
MEEEKKEKGFVIKDKRMFDESGDVRQEEMSREEAVPDQKTESAADPGGDDRSKEQAADYYPEVNFASFILSLSTSAMYHFGDFPDPVSKKAERNLPAAKQTIDILSMLKNKTTGNLDDGEKNLIDGMLFELRMRYVKEKDKR